MIALGIFAIVLMVMGVTAIAYVAMFHNDDYMAPDWTTAMLFSGITTWLIGFILALIVANQSQI